MAPLRPAVVGLLAVALVATGCGGEEKFEGSPDPAAEKNDRPAQPPAGWRTFANRRAGFTISIPRDWVPRTRRSATLIRSSDRLLAVSVAADRSADGREMRPRRYALRAFRALPGFRRLRVRSTRRVSGSPYPSRRVDGAGTLARRRQRQRITVAALKRPGQVTFAVVAFAAELDGRAPYAQSLKALLASLRGRRPKL